MMPSGEPIYRETTTVGVEVAVRIQRIGNLEDKMHVDSIGFVPRHRGPSELRQHTIHFHRALFAPMAIPRDLLRLVILNSAFRCRDVATATLAKRPSTDGQKDHEHGLLHHNQRCFRVTIPMRDR